jgi:hypothetical protein
VRPPAPPWLLRVHPQHAPPPLITHTHPAPTPPPPHPQVADITIACTYLALRMQPWAALIVLATVTSYVPLTICITERRGVIRKRMNGARAGR